MKNKWDHEAVNCQEDEDGFNLDLVSVFNNESADKKPEINSNKNIADIESSGARQRISERILSPSAK